jgi:hypothetical protein
VRTIAVLLDIAADEEEAVKAGTVEAIELTFPRK